MNLLKILKRLLVAVAGPMGVSVAHMGVALVLLSGVPAAEFGKYAFLQVIIAFGYGLLGALLISPVMVMLNREAKSQLGLLSSYLGASVVLCAAAGLLMVLVGCLLGNSWYTALWFGMAATLLWWRWFARGLLLAQHRKATVLISDAAYTLSLVGLTALAWSLDWLGTTEFLLLQCVAGFVGLVLLEPRFWQAQWAARDFTWAPFVDGFRRHARHSLVGVVTTEATANSQAYFITALLGPAAFAPVAAANLIFRPSSMVNLALTQAERPVLGQALQLRQPSKAQEILRFMALAMTATMLGNIVLAGLIVGWGAGYILHEPLPPGVLALATILIGIKVAISCIRAQSSLLLQADGQFKPLAEATVISSIITLPLVGLGAWLGGVTWALIGALAGEVIATALTVWYARKKVSL